MSTSTRILVVASLVVAALGSGILVGAGSPLGAGVVSANIDLPEPEPEPGPEPELPSPEPEPEPEPEPSPEPSPSPGPEPTLPPEDDGDDEEGEEDADSGFGEDCRPWQLDCYVVAAFRAWIAETVADFVNAQMMGTAMTLMLMTPPTSGIEAVWSTARTIVNSAFVLIVTLTGILVMGRQTAQTSTGIKEILPRLLFAFVTANASWIIVEQLSQAGNAISLAIVGDTADPDSVTDAFERFLDDPLTEGLIIVQLMLLSSVAGIIVLFTVIIRIMLWILLTAAAPLALAAHSLPQTEGLARLWWRAIGALLIMQISQSLTMRIIMTLFLTRDGISIFDPEGTAGSIMDLGVLMASLYVMIRIPFWAGKRVFNYHASPLVKGAKFAASLALLKFGLGKAALGKAVGNKAGAKAAAGRTAGARPTGQTWRYRPPKKPKWVQPELPYSWPRVPQGRQETLPGIDDQIDWPARRRARERRRWIQPPLPQGGAPTPRSSQPRQETIPGLEPPAPPRVGRQDPIPGLEEPPVSRQPALFAVTDEMRRPPRRDPPPESPRARAERLRTQNRVPHPSPPGRWEPVYAPRQRRRTRRNRNRRRR